MSFARWFSAFVVVLGLGLYSESALGQGKPSASAAAKPRKAPSKPPAHPKPPAKPSKATVESQLKDAAAAPPEGKASAQTSVKEKEDPAGVKTYQFGAIEVEGRLKSPKLIYFLRRVRAEFDAGALGHRSFLGELSDTRHAPSFR